MLTITECQALCCHLNWAFSQVFTVFFKQGESIDTLGETLCFRSVFQVARNSKTNKCYQLYPEAELKSGSYSWWLEVRSDSIDTGVWYPTINLTYWQILLRTPSLLIAGSVPRALQRHQQDEDGADFMHLSSFSKSTFGFFRSRQGQRLLYEFTLHGPN